MLLEHDTRIAVADGREMKVLRNAGTAIAPRLVAVASPKLVAEGHGSGGHHHSSAANPDVRQLEEDAYAAAAAGWLNAEILAGRIARLVVIAPPRTLGELRRHYHPELARRLVGEVGRELVDATPEEILAAIVAAA
jgi:protein required for attachment to host cells